MKLEFEGRIVCIHHIHKGLGGDFRVPLDHRRRYSVLDIKVGRDEATIIRPLNSRKLREWKGKPGEEVRSGDKVRVTIKKLIEPKRVRKRR